jgi:hypothetical protein
MTVITGSVGASSAVVARHLGQGPPADQGKQPPGCLVPYGHHQAPTPPAGHDPAAWFARRSPKK